jgi:hypothetical protein
MCLCKTARRIPKQKKGQEIFHVSGLVSYKEKVIAILKLRHPGEIRFNSGWIESIILHWIFSRVYAYRSIRPDTAGCLEIARFREKVAALNCRNSFLFYPSAPYPNQPPSLFLFTLNHLQNEKDLSFLPAYSCDWIKPGKCR